MHPAAKARLIAQLADQNRRSAKLEECPRCGADTLVGDDDDRAAVRVRVDAEPVDLVGEMLALLDGRPTFDLAKADGKRALYYREPWHIHGSNPDRWPIHVMHKCERRTLI